MQLSTGKWLFKEPERLGAAHIDKSKVIKSISSVTLWSGNILYTQKLYSVDDLLIHLWIMPVIQFYIVTVYPMNSHLRAPNILQ